MECGCSIDMEGEGPEFFSDSEHIAKKEHQCSECLRDILPGEAYRRESGKWDGEFKTYKTCYDCLSLRAEFFCSWIYGEIWADFRNDVWEANGEFNLSAMARLTPRARDMACNIIEEVWADLDDEEADEEADEDAA